MQAWTHIRVYESLLAQLRRIENSIRAAELARKLDAADALRAAQSYWTTTGNVHWANFDEILKYEVRATSHTSAFDSGTDFVNALDRAPSWQNAVAGAWAYVDQAVVLDPTLKDKVVECVAARDERYQVINDIATRSKVCLGRIQPAPRTCGDMFEHPAIITKYCNFGDLAVAEEGGK